MKLSLNQHEALLFISDRDVPAVGAIHQGTIQALNRRGLVEPAEFEPCCPVPLPSRWRITKQGRDYVTKLREEINKKLEGVSKRLRRGKLRPVSHDHFVELVGGERLYTHKASVCAGQACSVHNPSDHKMKGFKQHWRSDRALMERICSHGVGHPDPDHIDHVRRLQGDETARYEAVHGCDGCCK